MLAWLVPNGVGMWPNPIPGPPVVAIESGDPPIGPL